MKKRLITTLMTMTTLFAALPTTTWASTQTIDPADNQSFEVVASANVTDEDLAELGLNVVVSFPVEITLSIDGTVFLEKGEQQLECLVSVYQQDSGVLVSDCTTVVLDINYQ